MFIVNIHQNLTAISVVSIKQMRAKVYKSIITCAAIVKLKKGVMLWSPDLLLNFKARLLCWCRFGGGEP